MTIVVILVSLAPLVVLAVPVFVTYTGVKGLRNLKLIPLPVSKPRHDKDGLWADGNDFVFVGHFGTRLGIAETHMAIWRRPDRPSFFCRYTVSAGRTEQTSYDFVTIFDGDVIVTTSDRSGGQMLPLPDGYYCQSFSQLGLDAQWSRHVDAENFLMDVGGATLRSLDKPFEACFLDAVHKQEAFIKTIPLWPLRGIEWFFVRRHRRHDLSLQVQYDRHMTRLPNEFPWFGAGPIVSLPRSHPKGRTHGLCQPGEGPTKEGPPACGQLPARGPARDPHILW
jgi:hypothetical protein